MEERIEELARVMLCTGQTIWEEEKKAYLSISKLEVSKEVIEEAIMEDIISYLPGSGPYFIPTLKARELVGLEIPLTRMDAARKLNIGESTVRKYESQGKLMSAKVGGTALFSPAEIEGFSDGATKEPRERSWLSTAEVAALIGVNTPVLQKRVCLRLCSGVSVDRRGGMIWELSAAMWLSRNMRWVSRSGA